MSSEIDFYSLLTRLRIIFKLVQQLSWTVDQTEKRFPMPDAMTDEEIEKLTRFYLALGHDLEESTKRWKKLIKEYKKLDDTK